MPAPPAARSTIEIRAHRPTLFSGSGGWYAEEKFASRDRTSPGWLLMKKTPVAGSTSKTWEERADLLSPLETVPNCAEVHWFVTIYFEVRSVRLIEGDTCVRTSSLFSDGRRASVGGFFKDVCVGMCRDSDRIDHTGLAATRKA